MGCIWYLDANGEPPCRTIGRVIVELVYAHSGHVQRYDVACSGLTTYQSARNTLMCDRISNINRCRRLMRISPLVKAYMRRYNNKRQKRYPKWNILHLQYHHGL